VIFTRSRCLRGMATHRTLAVLPTVLVALAFPAIADASRSDRDRDKMPDRWERKHHLNTHRNDARRDLDRDGLRNLAEYRNGTDPRDKDSDDDGVRDDNDVVGTVKSFTGGTLTITTADGREIAGAVTDETEIECEKAAATTRHDDEDDDGERGDDEAGEDEDDGDDSCGAAALVAGAKVHEAELELTKTGAVWEEVEILVAS